MGVLNLDLMSIDAEPDAPPARDRERAAALRSRFAVDGGEPIVPSGRVMHSRWPRLDEDDIEGVISVLRSGRLTEMSGRDQVHQFERDVALSVGAAYALTTNSGTAALHCALAGLGVSAGDEVIVPALSYIACAAAVLHQNAIPVFADVDPRTYNLTPETVAERITPRTRAVMVVHLHGLPADVDGIRAAARPHGVAVLEDFSQAFGAAIGRRTVGSLGDAGAASLMAGKNLPSAGEGGVVVTSTLDVRNRAARLKCFGEELDEAGNYTLLHDTFGWNYRIGIVSLAVASQQLFRLDEFNDVRRASAARLDDAIAAIPGFSGPFVPDGHRHVYHMYRFSFDPAAAGLDVTADQLRTALSEIFWGEGLPVFEFQNMPLAGHPLLQSKTGYGRGCPWSCHGAADARYVIDDYPASLHAIRHSLVLGYPAQAPLANPTVVDAYVRCFEKIAANLHDLERRARATTAVPPWAGPARLF